MASTDDADTNRRFAESLGANFPILSDPKGDVARAYGVLRSEQGYAQRHTFYIDPDGLIRAIDRNVDPRTHGAAIAERLAELGFPRREAP